MVVHYRLEMVLLGDWQVVVEDTCDVHWEAQGVLVSDDFKVFVIVVGILIVLRLSFWRR